MQIYTTLTTSAPRCAALGCFDGLHIGHRRIINSMCGYAKENNLRSSVYTFEVSPAALLGKAPRRSLLSQEDKMDILCHLGVEECFSIDFSSVRNITPEAFVKDILIDKLGVKAVFCGFNYHFGRNAQGTSDVLNHLCLKYGIEAFVTSPVCYGDRTVSSGRIRDLIEQGDILTANRLLGCPFSVEQIITEGKHNGRTMGIPTVNQNLPAGFVTPRFGVYASYVYIDGQRYQSITNVGVRPTVGGVGKNIETHILTRFVGDLYGKKVRTQLLDFIRDEQKFDNLDDLALQIKDDIARVKASSVYNKYYN